MLLLFLFCSADDLKISNLFSTWLLKEASDNNNPLPLFTEKYLEPCLNWMQSKMEGNGINLIQQTLPFFAKIDNKEEFSVALIRGIGSGITDVEVLREFCEYVRRLNGVFFSNG